MTTRRTQPLKPQTKVKNSSPCPRRTLESSRNQLKRRLEQLDAGQSITPEILSDELDPMLQEQTKNYVLAKQLEKHLETIEQALQAADRGEYGICKRCGQPIAPERLQALPEARLCVRCKSAEEKSLRRGTVT